MTILATPAQRRRNSSSFNSDFRWVLNCSGMNRASFQEKKKKKKCEIKYKRTDRWQKMCSVTSTALQVQPGAEHAKEVCRPERAGGAPGDECSFWNLRTDKEVSKNKQQQKKN